MTSQQTESPQSDETRKNLAGTSPAGTIPSRASGVRAEGTVVEFRVSRPGMPLRRLRLGGARYTLGSGPESSIRLDDPSLQSTHAMLTRDGGQIELRSIAAPIAVNGRPITSTWLVTGDRFQLGQFDFELLSATARPGSPKPRRLSFADSLERTPAPGWPAVPVGGGKPEAAEEASGGEGAADEANTIPVEGQAADHRAILAIERRWQEKHKRQRARQRRREAEHRKQLEALLAAHAEAERRAGESEQTVLEVRGQVAELSQQVATLTNTAGLALEQRQTLETLRGRVDSVQEIIDGVQREASDIREQTVSVREDQREVLANAELLEKMIRRLSECRDLDRAGQSLELNEMRENLLQLSSKLSHTSGQLTETQESSQTLNAEVEQLRSSLQVIRSDTQRCATIEQIDAVENQLRVTDARLTELFTDCDSQAGQLRQECELLRQRIEEFEQAAAEKFAALEHTSRNESNFPQPIYQQPDREVPRAEEPNSEESHYREHVATEEAPPVWSYVAPVEAEVEDGSDDRGEEVELQRDEQEAEEAFGATAVWAVPSEDLATVTELDTPHAQAPKWGESEWDQPASDQTMMWSTPPDATPETDTDAEAEVRAEVKAEADTFGGEDESEVSLEGAAAAARVGPRSAAEILASMGMAYGDDEEVDEAPPAAGQGAAEERLTPSSFESSAPGFVNDDRSPGRATAEADVDALGPPDDDSIEAYMNRLLQRVQGGSTGASIAPSPAITRPVEPTHRDESSASLAGASATPAGAAEPLGAAPLSAHQSAVAGSSLPAEPAPYIPRSQAPERTSNLAAMRELANNSARSAIAHSVRKRMVHQQISKFALCGVAIFTGGAIMFASEFSMDHWLLAACCCFCLAIFFLIEGLNLRKQLQATAAVPESETLKTETLKAETAAAANSQAVISETANRP